jgi:O-antigen/teichoic acid export membrane protein
MAALAVIAHVSEAPTEIRQALYIAGGGVIAAMQAMILANVFRALELMSVTSVGFVLHKVALLALVVLAAVLGLGLPGMSAAFALAFGILWAYYFVMVARRHFWPWPHGDVRRWLGLVREALPLGVAGILRKMSGRIDVLILGALAAPGAVGHFAAAYKIVEGLALVPLTIAQILFPLLSRSARSATGLFETVFALGIKSLLFVGVPAAVALALTADRVVRIAFGPQFDPAASTLVVIAVAIVMLFPSALLPFVFAALRLQRSYIVATAAAITVNVAVDVVLVPRLGALGAGLGLLTGETVFLLVGAAVLVPRALGPRLLARLAWRPVVAGAGMAAVVLLARPAGPATLVAALAAGVAVYGALLIALGAVSRAELAAVRQELGARLAIRVSPVPRSSGVRG